jgi:flagellar basal body P-ring formation protein FlgA
VGQRLNGALNPGGALRQSQLQKRMWFAAGDAVRVTARGEGFAVSQQGQALTPGIEGQATRVRTENGKVIVAMPDGAGSATVLLAPR